MTEWIGFDNHQLSVIAELSLLDSVPCQCQSFCSVEKRLISWIESLNLCPNYHNPPQTIFYLHTYIKKSSQVSFQSLLEAWRGNAVICKMPDKFPEKTSLKWLFHTFLFAYFHENNYFKQLIDYQFFYFNQLIVQTRINVKRSNIHLISCPINYLVTLQICLVTPWRGPNPQVGKFLP